MSCDNMFFNSIHRLPSRGRGLILARVITLPMMLSVLLLPESSGGSGVTAKRERERKGRVEKRKAESRCDVGLRETASDKDEEGRRGRVEHDIYRCHKEI